MKIKDSSVISIVHNKTFDVEDIVEVGCDLCGGYGGESIDKEHLFSVIKCSKCGMIYVSPQPTQDSLDKYYASFYIDTSSRASETWKHDHSFIQVKRIIRANGFRGGSLLDIGCGFGHFLNMINGPGWRLTGIEPNTQVVKFTSRADESMKIINGDFLEYGFDERYDVITSLASLEHMKSPSDVLAKAYDLLNKNGLIVARVPYVEPFLKFKKHLYLGVNMGAPRHLFDFSPKTLYRYLEKTGFKNIRVYVGSRERVEGLINRASVLLSKTISKALYYSSFRKVIFPFCGGIVATGRKI